jgi:hypothetical protein
MDCKNPRRAVGWIPSHQVGAGNFLCKFAIVVSLAGPQDARDDDLPESGGSFGKLAALRELNTALQSRIDAQDKQLEANDEQTRELHVLLQQAQAALPTARGDRPWWRFWTRE